MLAKLIGRTGGTAGHDFVIGQSAGLGALPDNEIRIVAPGVSRRHARIVRENDQYWLEDAGAVNGTFLNGGRIHREPLRHLDVITLGRSVDLIFLFRAGEAASVNQDHIVNVTIVFISGPEAGIEIAVKKGELTFGRAETCNVVFASPAVSKMHARLQRSGGQVLLQDLRSANGTFVNGHRIESVVVLQTGDLINFGGVHTASVTIEADGPARSNQVPQPMALPAFDQEWKTRFVWAPEELAAIEAARAEAVALASLRSLEAEPAVTPVASRTTAVKQAGHAAPKAKPPTDTPIAPPAMRPVAPPQVKDSLSAPDAAAPEAEGQGQRAEETIDMPHPFAAAPESANGLAILGVRLVGRQGVVEFGLGTFSVGRAVDSDVCLEDRQASRAHARIVVEPSVVSVEDLQTVNGTLVNGREIKGRQPLSTGDSVEFGVRASRSK